MSDVPVVGDIYDAGKSVAEGAVNVVTGGLGSVLAKPDAPDSRSHLKLRRLDCDIRRPTPIGSTTETQTEFQESRRPISDALAAEPRRFLRAVVSMKFEWSECLSDERCIGAIADEAHHGEEIADDLCREFDRT
jgi:hypothetical protein